MCSTDRPRLLLAPVVVALSVLASACGGATKPVSKPPATTPTTALTVSPTKNADVEVSLAPLDEGIWLHTSVRVLEPYGRVLSHGLVLVGSEGAVLVDTAWGVEPTRSLLADIEASLGIPVTAAVLTDFHADRAGGVSVLGEAGVEVHTSSGIIDRVDGAGFAQRLPQRVSVLRLAGVDVEVFSAGAGHSAESLVVWIPRAGLLFGGCLIRPLESEGLGNTADADIEAWGPTVRAVRERYPQVKRVVPSHGAPAGVELLEHTIELVEGALPSPPPASPCSTALVSSGYSNWSSGLAPPNRLRMSSMIM